MNNAVQVEEMDDMRPDTSIEQARLTRLLEAIDALLQSKDWTTLQELHFSKEEERIERLLSSEAKKDLVEDSKIYRLQGELIWARRYADMARWAKFLKNQLDNLKKHG